MGSFTRAIVFGSWLTPAAEGIRLAPYLRSILAHGSSVPRIVAESVRVFWLLHVRLLETSQVSVSRETFFVPVSI